MKPNEFSLLVIIAERKLKDRLIASLQEADARYFNVVYAHGSAQHNSIVKALGLSVEHEKVVIYCFIKQENGKPIMNDLIGKFKFDKPNTGIAFTIPIIEAVR